MKPGSRHRWGLRGSILAWKNILAFHLLGNKPRSARGSKVAIFKLDRLGDFTLALGAIRALIRRHGQGECVLFISPPAEELARREFPTEPRVVIPPFARDIGAAWPGLRSQASGGWWDHSFDLAVSLRHQRSPWQELLFSRLRCTKRVAITNQPLSHHPSEQRWISTSLSKTRPAPILAGGSTCLELEAHRQLLELVWDTEVRPQEVVPHLVRPVGLQPNGALLLCPFGSAELRTLPVTVIVAAIKEFRKSLPLPLRLAAAPTEVKRYTDYADMLVAGGLPRPVIVTTPTLEALLCELAGSRVVLTTESAPAHLSVALDQPTVVLLGGGHHGMFGPWTRSQQQVWLTHPMDCYHCDWQCCHPEPYCLTRIAPTAVAQALLKVAAEG